MEIGWTRIQSTHLNIEADSTALKQLEIWILISINLMPEWKVSIQSNRIDWKYLVSSNQKISISIEREFEFTWKFSWHNLSRWKWMELFTLKENEMNQTGVKLETFHTDYRTCGLAAPFPTAPVDNDSNNSANNCITLWIWMIHDLKKRERERGTKRTMVVSFTQFNVSVFWRVFFPTCRREESWSTPDESGWNVLMHPHSIYRLSRASTW